MAFTARPSRPHLADSFNAKHSMFQYDRTPVPENVRAVFEDRKNLVIVGTGGSSLPLRAFTDFFGFDENIYFLDSPERRNVEKALAMTGALYCVVSKSGETLEVKSIFEELRKRGKKDFLIVTDPKRGSLRKWAEENSALTLEIPEDIGGRFTNFSIFHRAVLEAMGVSFDELLDEAARVRDLLRKDAMILQSAFWQLFGAGKSRVILWAYGERTRGLAYWMQQVIGESLGKRNAKGQRFGVMPVVLRGPQDQHSVLQLLMDGPQEQAIWFLRDSSGVTKQQDELQHSLAVLAEATFRSFQERLENLETEQPIMNIDCSTPAELVNAIVTVQAFVEYAGRKLGVDPFDQPGVERGKVIARELLAKTAQLSGA